MHHSSLYGPIVILVQKRNITKNIVLKLSLHITRLNTCMYIVHDTVQKLEIFLIDQMFILKNFSKV